MGADNIFSVQRRSDGAVVGMIFVEPVGSKDGRTEVSYQLLPEYGATDMREAASAAVAWALEGRARSLSGPSPDLSQPGLLHPPISYRALRKSRTRWVRSAVASGSYDGRELSAK